VRRVPGVKCGVRMAVKAWGDIQDSLTLEANVGRYSMSD